MSTQAARAPRVVIVADVYGDLSPAEAAAQVAAGWLQRAPHATVEAFGSHGGGAGFAAVVGAACSGSATPVIVPGPLGADAPAQITWVQTDGRRTAYLDTAQVCGRHLVGADDLADPTGMSSAGIGRLLTLAREGGADRIVVSVGDLACHDAGTGLLRELGAGEDLQELGAVRKEWLDSGCHLVLVTPNESTLLGFHGASATLKEKYGIAPEVAQRLESVFGELTDQVNRLLPPARDLLSGLPRRPEREAGSGAGGGVGYALQLLGAQTDTAARFLLDELGIAPRLPGALLVLVSSAYDVDTVHEGVIPETAQAALDVATPTIVLAREVSVSRREGMALGINGAYEPRAGESLRDLSSRIARTWTPPPLA